MAALLEVLERKGLNTKQEVLDAVQELRRKTPNAQARQEPFPEPCLSTETSGKVLSLGLTTAEDLSKLRRGRISAAHVRDDREPKAAVRVKGPRSVFLEPVRQCTGIIAGWRV